MKYLKPKLVCLRILIGLLPYFGAAQIPVTDVAANAQLVILNQNVATLNSQLVTLNSTMGKLLAQMERNVTANSSASKILSQDLTAKRTPASYVMGSPEMTELYDLKDKIVEAYKGTQKNLRSFANLEKVEKERATEALADALVQVTSLVSQGSHIASTGEIIESADRLSALRSILDRMDSVLETIIKVNTSLLQKNEHRKAVYSLIKTN
ncbi:hypothetical protein HZY62_08705 [Maribacter polysiphoniae]|uniref:Uncharacterized protein n=2 Tax=Flavobacteriaceae TaxID=49546 RepID=A0A316E2E1_9FLAO|nr:MULTISPECIES: hypothetical protein [Flavobacteriaceae]MBD1260665.1 hypothetical protein [Maribacter polysiphoniae]PWK24206.1 hypothetical protein LX92_01793 [Maribacter polysiphoniae]RPG36700.1 MAG: hypothetical protein CBB72_003595 [Muricauda sp. TMED12]RYC51679.1 hypothetical protein DN53_12660 [Allomuricauda olearia]|tara:strand:+ start:62745 stop:63374 length:630 start_codon:yes stop_codon:yes gene_type:complete